MAAIQYPLPNLIRAGATNGHEQENRGTHLMITIVAIAVVGILALQATGSIPLASVGGSLVIGFAFITGVFVVAIYEAVLKRRGVLGWTVNIVVSFFGAFVTAQIAGVIIIAILSPFFTGSSLAKTGGPVLSIGLAASMAITLLGAWWAIQLVNRWRDSRKTARQP